MGTCSGVPLITDAEANAGKAWGEGARAVIVWGAEGLKKTDVSWACCGDRGGDPYFVARIGPKGAPWADLPRARGRRGAPARGTSAPRWETGFVADVAGVDEPVLHVRVYDKDFLTEDDLLGSASASVSSLMAAGSPVDMDLGPGCGKVSVSMGLPALLEEHKIDMYAGFPELNKNGTAKTCQARDVRGDFPLRTGVAPLPAALRGVFWLSDQGEESALVSFGGPSNDGGGCSTGHLLGTRYKVRCGGDRSWADAAESHPGHIWLDLIYHFVFDDEANPTKGQIYPEVKLLKGVPMTAESLLDFEMLIVQDAEYPGSVVWRRDTSVLGHVVASVTYKVVQIIDENGDRIEPAFSKFVAYQEDPKFKEPGTIWYREI